MTRRSQFRFAPLTRESATQGEALLWQLYDGIRPRPCCCAGAESDLLTRETAQAMAKARPEGASGRVCRCRPRADLIAPDQVDCVTGFLLAPDAARG
jgi:hypothetical protein